MPEYCLNPLQEGDHVFWTTAVKIVDKNADGRFCAADDPLEELPYTPQRILRDVLIKFGDRAGAEYRYPTGADAVIAASAVMILRINSNGF
jgi:hypothetical protein